MAERLGLVLLSTFSIDSESMLALICGQPFNFKSGNRPDVHGDRNYSSRSRIQRTELIDTLFFGGNVFEITLLLLKTHIAQPQLALQFWSDAIAKAGQRERFDVHRECPRQRRITADIFTILFDGNRFVFSVDELRLILKGIELSRHTPQSGR